MKRLLLLLLLFTLPAWGADRYWVGDGGTWDNASTTHWSASDGGASGASAPTATDDVHFTANSFTAAGQTVVAAATAVCRDMIWTGATNTPTLSAGAGLTVYGSMTLIATMTAQFGSVTMAATSIGHTVTTAGRQLDSLSFAGSGGGWTLQDPVAVRLGFSVTDGTLAGNGQTVTVEDRSGGLLQGAAQFTVASPGAISGVLNVSCSGGTGLIGHPCTFNGGGQTYGTVTLGGNPHSVATSNLIQGSNTFGSLVLAATSLYGSDGYLEFTDGTTQTITGDFTVGATPTARIYLIGTGTAGWTLSKASGKVIVRNVSLQYSHATGGAQFRADQSIDAGGNTGWWFGGANSPIMGCIF